MEIMSMIFNSVWRSGVCSSIVFGVAAMLGYYTCTTYTYTTIFMKYTQFS